MEPRDRIGMRLRQDGFTTPEDFEPEHLYLLDIELWDFGRREARTHKLDEIANYIETHGGEALDRYVGPSISMLRARITGDVARTLLGSVEQIAEIDLPPRPDVGAAEALELELADLPPVNEVPDDAPLIGVIDSGVNAHPLLEDVLVGAIGVPEYLGTADEYGHGTRVSGIALFGDVRRQLATDELVRVARLVSAKVVNGRGAFDERSLVPSQMREALTI